MKRVTLGTENLNIELQSILNISKLFIKRGANKYKLGDKVMQIKIITIRTFSMVILGL